MRRGLIVGAVCFLVGAIGLAFAQTTGLRPEQFIALPWTWSGIQSFNDGKFVLNGSSSGSSTVKAPATGGGTATLPTGSGTLVYSAGGGANLVVGTTAITSGTSGRILYDNAGVLGEATVTGSLGNVVLSTSPSISGLTVTSSFTATGLVTNADLVSPSITIAGSTCTLGSSCLGSDGNFAFLDVAQSFTKPQRVKGGNVAISTATFTFDLSAQQDFEITLVHASCPCTIANPTNISAAASDHQHGVIIVNQSATGSDTIGTWGSQWVAAGGVSALPALSTGANAQDIFAYDVIDSTHILIAPVAANVSH
jgi:hypothetical protein